MKKNFVTLAAALLLLGCSKNENLGDPNLNVIPVEDAPILFTSGAYNTTRADIVGAAAASKLNEHFVVYGTKHVDAEIADATKDALVFDQYQVAWTDNSAGSSESNTHNWEYVGLSSYGAAAPSSNQAIKYWDYSANNGYTFYAFSSSNISYPAVAADLVSVTKTPAGTTKYDKGYEVTIKNGASLDDLYYSDRLEVTKANYNQPVTLTFRNVGARVRVGFFETVPGYSVKIDKFYFDHDASAAVTTYAAMDQTSTSFKAALQSVKTNAASNVLNVTYYDNTVPAIENHVKVTNTTVTYNYDLTLGSFDYTTAALSTEASNPTWDNDGAYTTVYPFEAQANAMLIRLDYTLISDDATHEEIHVKNARVYVPVQYLQWKSNFAYTYLFKISSNTNGTTGGTPADPDHPSDDPSDDPEGLFPITFDAVVINAVDAFQESITTVATKNVTTYAQGKIANEYMTSQDIYSVITDPVGKNLVTPTGVGVTAGKVQVYKIGGSAAATATEAEVMANLTGAPSNITLTATTTPEDASMVYQVPSNGGSYYEFGTSTNPAAVKFTPTTAGKYAFVYCETPYVAPTYASCASDSWAAGTYYFKSTVLGTDVYFAASDINAANWDANKANLYKQTAAGTPGVYTVKVIRVGVLVIGDAATYVYPSTSPYTYKSVITESGSDVTFTFAPADYTPINVRDDMARYLGALYYAAGATAITWGSHPYEWNPAKAGHLHGSNWFSLETNHTLVKDITDWFALNPTATSITINVNGEVKTLHFVHS